VRVCVPAADNVGLESQSLDHFGSAPCFVSPGTESRKPEVLANPSAQQEHGGCRLLAVFEDHVLDALLVGANGAGAIAQINAPGICVHQSEPGTTAGNLVSLLSGKLVELRLERGCRQHGGCSQEPHVRKETR